MRPTTSSTWRCASGRRAVRSRRRGRAWPPRRGIAGCARCWAGLLLIGAASCFRRRCSSRTDWWRSGVGAAPTALSESGFGAGARRAADAARRRAVESRRRAAGVTDLYFVGFAGDARDDDFRKDVLAAQRVMDERWDTRGRSIVLIEQPGDAARHADGDGHEPARDAERDRRRDRCRRGRRDGVSRGPAAAATARSQPTLPPLELVPLIARGAADAARRGRHRVADRRRVGVPWRTPSSRRSRTDTTIVLAARRRRRGVQRAQRDATRFGDALFATRSRMPSRCARRSRQRRRAVAAGSGGEPPASRSCTLGRRSRTS